MIVPGKKRDTYQHINYQLGSGRRTNPQYNLATARNVDNELADGVKRELEGLQESHDIFQGDGKVDVKVNRDHIHRAHLQRGTDGRESTRDGLDEGEFLGHVWEREQHVPSARTCTMAVPIVPFRMVAEDGKRWKVVRRSGFCQISESAGIELNLAGSDSVMDDEGLEGLVRREESDEIWTERHIRRKPT